MLDLLCCVVKHAALLQSPAGTPPDKVPLQHPPPNEGPLMFDNNPKAFGLHERRAMGRHQDPALALLANYLCALEDLSIQLQSELTCATVSQSLADTLVLFDNTFAFAASFL